MTRLVAAQVLSPGALYAAAMRAPRGKRHRPAVAHFLLELEPVLHGLREALLDGSWRPSRPRLHMVRDPKPRTISVAPFGDRVVHQALAAVLAPRLDRRLIYDTYACRVAKGTHAALARARAWARTYRWYVHLDVAKFFPSCDHAVIEKAQAARTNKRGFASAGGRRRARVGRSRVGGTRHERKAAYLWASPGQITSCRRGWSAAVGVEISCGYAGSSQGP